jgi:hypothetical protein
MKRDVTTVTPSTRTLDALQLMRRLRVGCLPVVDADRLVGIVTEEDFMDIASKMLEDQLSADGGLDRSGDSLDRSAGLWPGGGARLPDGSVVVFLSEVVAADGGLGFAAAGWRAVRIADPSGPPDGWRVDAVATAPAAIGDRAIVGACVALDGEHLVAMAIDDGSHDGYVVRWPLTDAAAGDLRRPAWWTGQAWEVGGAPRAILTDAATECSLHRDPSTGQWLHVTSRGFGATTIALRTAPRPEGPWSAPTDVFAPPESMVDDAFVYAGKAHPHLRGPTGGLVVTYADNSFTFADLFDPARADTLYWPHTAELALRPR